MEHSHAPVMDLNKLRPEILTHSPEAALPCNLSNHWLAQVEASLEQVLQVGGEESGQYMAGPLALILHLLRGKAGSDEFEVSEDKLFEHFVDYRIEVALEEVNRRSDIKSTSATLATIFTNRSVESVRKDG
jgi:hypothetical protein